VLPGDAITVISAQGRAHRVGMVPKMRRYTVIGTVQVGMHEYDSSIAYLSLHAARDFAGLPGVTGIEGQAGRSLSPPARWAGREPQARLRVLACATGAT